ncbi:uncharacterized protein LOC133905695 [Phragmites australis]|uniref:uncharacterized protein LOC133905695 n=1 Tax=Phragmites australis TaxID=29695 RepID=UPI002D7A28F3|nr:uncharacterized protein LOC133905695 [Phragmites australis]
MCLGVRRSPGEGRAAVLGDGGHAPRGWFRSLGFRVAVTNGATGLHMCNSVFSPCGEIVVVRIMEDHNGLSKVADITDPYESAVISLPSAVNKLLLHILHLGIGTRYDIDIHCVKSLNELPESSAVAVLNQACSCVTF